MGDKEFKRGHLSGSSVTRKASLCGVLRAKVSRVIFTYQHCKPVNNLFTRPHIVFEKVDISSFKFFFFFPVSTDLNKVPGLYRLRL